MVRVNGEGPIERLASINHPIKAQLSEDQTSAFISLRDTVDRTLVPCKDFVLRIRDKQMTEPSVVSAITPSD